MAIKTRFSEDSPVRFTLKGIPEINTDLWKISGLSCSNSNILTNISDDGKSFELISPSKTEKSTGIYLDIDFVGMPIKKDPITKFFDWEGEYVESIKPVYHVEGITEASNGSVTYRLVIDNAAEYTYPISCEWSIAKVHGIGTASESIGISNDTIFNVTYTNLSQEDAIASTVFEIAVVIKAKHNPSKIIDTFTFKIHTSYEDPVITKENNPIIMNYCYMAGFCSDPNKMYKDECAAVTSIKADTFRGNGVPKSFDEFQYFTGLTEIPDSAFKYDSSTIESITLPNTITSIGISAFQGCYGLKSITFPAGVTVIPTRVLYYCYNLKTVNCLGAITDIGTGAFEVCREISEINADFSNLRSIGADAFHEALCGPKNTHTLDLKDSKITSLPSECFYSAYSGKGLTLSLPETLTNIGSKALAHQGMETIYMYSVNSPIVAADSFDNMGKNIKTDKNLYIPGESIGYENWNLPSGWNINKYL